MDMLKSVSAGLSTLSDVVIDIFSGATDCKRNDVWEQTFLQ